MMDIERSKRFYDALLGLLGAGEPHRGQAPTGQPCLIYRHEGSSFGVTEPINGHEATFANGGVIGFKCNSPEQVQQFHDVESANGGTTCEDPLSLR
jgi:catechol 2,3-dioxygenase-like lactoylglutathione lyase family enzyme